MSESQGHSDSVSQASGAAVKVALCFHKRTHANTGSLCQPDCTTNVFHLCRVFVPVCLSYQAIEREDFKNREGKIVKTVAKINEGLCQGCGTCVALCRSKSIDLYGYSNNQVYAEVVALLNEF